MDTGNLPPSPQGEEPSASNPEVPNTTPAQPLGGATEGQPDRRGDRNRRGRGRKGHRRHGQQQGPNRSANAHNRGGNRHGTTFTGPMDHSYRQNGQDASDQRQRGEQFGRRGRFRQQFGKNRNRTGGTQSFAPPPFPSPVEPLPYREDAQTRIFAFVEDLFFMTKIMDTAKKLNVKVEFVKAYDELMDKIGQSGDEKPSLVIFDLNNSNAKPLTTIPKVKSKLKKATSILGFVSHVQGDLKLKAQEAGCDSVMPRSAFSQNLPQLLRRHGAPEELEQGE